MLQTMTLQLKAFSEVLDPGTRQHEDIRQFPRKSFKSLELLC